MSKYLCWRKLTLSTLTEALVKPPLSLTPKLQLMESLHGTETIIGNINSEWKNYTFDEGAKNKNMTLESFLNSSSSIVPNCFTAGRESKPIQDRPINDCRLPNIFYTKIHIQVDLSSLDQTRKPTVRFSTYLHLKKLSNCLSSFFSLINSNNESRTSLRCQEICMVE